MDLSAVKNGDASVATSHLLLTPDVVAKILAPFTDDQLLSIVASTLATSPAVVHTDPAHRRLFVRGLGWDTTSVSLCAVFAPISVIEEAALLQQRCTGGAATVALLPLQAGSG